MARRSSSGGGSNTKLLLIIGIFAFAIIIGTLVGKSYFNREKFTNNNQLIYLYMENCGHCKKFNETWNKINESVKDPSNANKYKFTTHKYDLMNDDKGIKYATENKIDYAPAILFISSNDKVKIFDENSRMPEIILEWAVKEQL